MKCFRFFKVSASIAGKRIVEQKQKEKVQIDIQGEVKAAQLRNDNVESMVKELEEQYRIELRKKAILKNQCDQAYLRGVSAISQEALKMSYSKLEDFYKGMRMPAYDGKNIHN